MRLTAETYRGKLWETNTKPRLLACGDGRDYVVKGVHAGRVLVNDHVVGRLGLLLGAPVPDVRIVEVSQVLIDLEPGLEHLTAGPAHGSAWVPNCSDSLWIQYAEEAHNRQRFAALAVLYGSISSSDEQFIYENTPPHLVYSVDHGNFFPGGPEWRAIDFATATPAAPLRLLLERCNLSKTDVRVGVQIIPPGRAEMFR